MSEATKYCHRCEMEVELKKDVASNAMKCSICGTILVHSANHLPQGTILNGFEIISEIGRGGMGIVYNANQLNLDRSVALKVLSDDLANDEEFVERFFKEARAAASLNHPNIVQVFDAGSTLDGIYYFAMELVTGETLESRIEREGAFPPKEAVQIAVKISDALDYAWKSQKLTHGDIKPDNIIMNEFGEVKLADLGLAKFIHEEVATDGIMVTPLYAPPEIIRADAGGVSFKSDMYSFGATLYHLLAGVPPFPDGPPEQLFMCHLNETPPSLSTHNERLSAPLVKLVDELLAKDPEKRPESWEELCKSLKRIKEPEGAGKVFRKKTHARDERARRNIEKQHFDEAGDALPEPASVSLMIKLLSAFALILLVAIAVVLSMSRRSATSPAPPSTTASSHSAAASESDPVEEWKLLQRRMNAMSDANSMKELEKFVAKFGRSCPPAALKRLRQLKNKAANLARRQKEKNGFLAAANALEKRVRAVLKSKKKIATVKLVDCKKRVNAVFAQASRKPYLRLPNRQRNFFRSSLAALNAELADRERRLKERIRAQQEKKRLERLAAERRARQKLREQRAARLAAAAMADDYYKILAAYESKRKLPMLEKSLREWRARSKNAGVYSARSDFIMNTIIPNSKNAFALLKKREKELLGRRLPSGVCSEKLSKYTVREISETGIKLQLRKGTVFLGHTLKWARISPQKMVALLRKVVLESEKSPPTIVDERKVLSYAVVQSPDVAGYLLSALRTLRHDEIQRWKDVIRDMNEATRERGLILLYERMRDDLKAGEKLKASDKFIKLSVVGKDSLFAKRYSGELKALKPMFSEINPKISASDWAEKILAYDVDRVGARNVFSHLMTFNARYGGVLDGLDEKVVEELARRGEEVLSRLERESGVSDIKDNRVPFYYWTRERPGGAWAFFKLAERDPRLKALPKLLASMRLAAALANGDWRLAGAIFKNREAMTSKELVRIRRLRSWLPSFVFANGLVAMQYGDPKAVSSASDSLLELSRSGYGNSAVSALSRTLAMELLISRRETEAAIAVGRGQSYDGKMSRWRIEGRTPLLEVLARCMANRKPRKAIRKFSKKYGGVSKLAGDVFWLSAAAKLTAGSPLNQRLTRKLQAARCYFADTTARIMVSALAQCHVESEKIGGDDKLLKVVEGRLTPSIVSSDLWRRTSLLRMAAGKQPHGFVAEARRRLNDMRTCSSRSYPFLLELKFGAQVAEGKLSPETARKILAAFLQASLVVSKDEIEMLAVMTDDNPESVVKRLFADHKPAAAVRAGFLAIATRKDGRVRMSVSSVMQENASYLQWEELYLLRVMERWRR